MCAFHLKLSLPLESPANYGITYTKYLLLVEICVRVMYTLVESIDPGVMLVLKLSPVGTEMIAHWKTLYSYGYAFILDRG